MSVNIYDSSTGILTPVAGLTVPAPTPDYVDVQFNSATQYAAGNSFIYGNKRYKVKTACINVTPPNSTYYEELSVADELKESVTVTVPSGFSLTGSSVTQVGNLVAGNIGIQTSTPISTNSWVTIGKISKTPIQTFDRQFKFPVINGSVGIFCGMAGIWMNGDIKVYLSQGAAEVYFNLAFKTNG